MSYPAAKADPRVGSRALSDSFLIWSEGTCSIAAAGVPLSVEVVFSVFALFAGGDTGGEVTEGSVMVVKWAAAVQSWWGSAGEITTRQA